jgi:hypothetical protein
MHYRMNDCFYIMYMLRFSHWNSCAQCFSTSIQEAMVSWRKCRRRLIHPRRRSVAVNQEKKVEGIRKKKYGKNAKATKATPDDGPD